MTYLRMCVYLWGLVAVVFLILPFLNKKQAAIKEKSASRLTYIICLAAGMTLIFYDGLPYGYLANPFYNDTEFWSWVGVGMTAAGIVFSLWARFVLGSNWSGVVMIKKDHELVQKGPYAIIRHPTYSGFILALLGTVLALNEWRGVIALLILIVSFIWKINKEEKMLSQQFPAYSTYQSKTKKLIPFIY